MPDDDPSQQDPPQPPVLNYRSPADERPRYRRLRLTLTFLGAGAVTWASGFACIASSNYVPFGIYVIVAAAVVMPMMRSENARPYAWACVAGFSAVVLLTGWCFVSIVHGGL